MAGFLLEWMAGFVGIRNLIDTPAKTLAGLIFRARYAATHYEDNYDEDVMISIVDDLLAMADEEEGSANV